MLTGLPSLARVTSLISILANTVSWSSPPNSRVSSHKKGRPDLACFVSYQLTRDSANRTRYRLSDCDGPDDSRSGRREWQSGLSSVAASALLPRPRSLHLKRWFAGWPFPVAYDVPARLWGCWEPS